MQGGPLPERTVRALGAALAKTLIAVHGQGLTFAGVSPAAVLCAADVPRVTCFGAVRGAAPDGTPRSGLPGLDTGSFPPEQASGGRPRPSGTSTPSGRPWATPRRPHDTGARRDPCGIRTVITRCLSRDPGNRPQLIEVLDESIGDSAPGDAGAESRLVTWGGWPGNRKSQPAPGPSNSLLPEKRLDSLWQIQVADPDNPYFTADMASLPSQPRVVGDLVVLMAGMNLNGVAARTGRATGSRTTRGGPGRPRPTRSASARIRWTVPVPAPFRTRVLPQGAADRGTLVVSTTNGHALALSTKTGRSLWTLYNQARKKQLVPVARNGVVYLNGKSLSARGISTGKEIWQATNAYATPPEWGPAEIHGDFVYSIVGDMLTRCHIHTGDDQGWSSSEPAEGQVVVQGSGAWVVHQKYDATTISTVSLDDGSGIWHYDVYQFLGQTFPVHLAADGNRAFATTNGGLIAFPVF